ncbi:uncharacterized protein LOC106865674 [Brachypodium distachyon]|uniref:uncharacterized protein LOC106865674 n=1 Tax=Brachypodium distachyon TaxID=15368 RepID=UPI00071E0BEF|nr:uncharacterized protein LOC106865674 [Brachypodium distachyon]|eukprot:XP_014751751.1 uncharacterized protein LOC106865674 [Brachypodium distachyon]
MIYMLIYVDDIVIASSCSKASAHLLQQLQAAFPIKDLGPLRYFLGIEATATSGGMNLCQQKYAADLLHRAHMEHCRPVSTPMAVQDPLAHDVGTPLQDEDVFRYRSMVGGLQYLTMTRPDISFAVNKVCQYLAAPTDTHWEAVKRILRYVKGTMTTGINILRVLPFSSARKQPTVSRSSTEAEPLKSRGFSRYFENY